MRKNRGELATILTIATLVVLGVMTTLSATVLKDKKIGYKSKAADENSCKYGITNITIDNPPSATNKIFRVNVGVSDTLTGHAGKTNIVGIKKNGEWPGYACLALPNGEGENVTTTFSCDISSSYSNTDTLEVVVARMLSDFENKQADLGLTNRPEFQKKWSDFKSSTSEQDKTRFQYYMTKCTPEQIWSEGNYRIAATYKYGELGGGAPVATSTSAPVVGVTTAPTVATAVPTTLPMRLETWKFSAECGGDSSCYCRKLNMDPCAPATQGGLCIPNAWDEKWGCKARGGSAPQPTRSPISGGPTAAPGAGTISSSNSETCMKCIFDKDNNLARQGLFMCKDSNGNKQWFTGSQGCKDQFNNWCSGVDPNGCKAKKTECLVACSDTPLPAATLATSRAGTVGTTSSTPTTTPVPTEGANPSLSCSTCRDLVQITIKAFDFSNLFSNTTHGFQFISPEFKIYDPSGKNCTIGYDAKKYRIADTNNQSSVIRVDDDCGKLQYLICDTTYYGYQTHPSGGYYPKKELKVISTDMTHFQCKPSHNQNQINEIEKVIFQAVESIPTATPKPGATNVPIPSATQTPSISTHPVSPTNDPTNGARRINTHVKITSRNQYIPSTGAKIGIMIANDYPATTLRFYSHSVTYLVSPILVTEKYSYSTKSMEFNFSSPYQWPDSWRKYTFQELYSSLHAEFCYLASSTATTPRCVYDDKWFKNLVWWNFSDNENYDFNIVLD